jgi:pyruvate-formate lyase-activating enzyme
MSTAALIRDVLDLTRSVSERGVSDPAFDGLRVFQHPERLREQLTGRGEAVPPVTIDAWPSLSCNARCPLCPFRLSGARDEVDRSERLSLLSQDVAQSVLAGAARTGVRSVIFSGGGEPLLHPNVTDPVDQAVKAGLQWALFTNGLRMTPPLAAALLARGPAFLRVSLDAGTADEHAQVYALPPSAFEAIVANVIAAAKTARDCGTRAFGLSFTLLPTVSDSQLMAIKSLLQQILIAAGDGLGFVAFRPRVVHYQQSVPVIPQPRADAYAELPERLDALIVRPLLAGAGSHPRMDIKGGLFALAARRRTRNGCLSSGWMTTIDEKGRGFITAELAGANEHKQSWGRVEAAADFPKLWHGPDRVSLYRDVVSGRIRVPVVHRTSPIDEFLSQLLPLCGGVLEGTTADAVIRAVTASPFYRSSRAEFV